MSLYEVSEIVVGQSFLVRDLLRGGEPLRISERTATKSLTTWDRIGARVIELNGKRMIAGGVLPFTHEASEELIRASRPQQEEDAAGAEEIGKEVGCAGRDQL